MNTAIDAPQEASVDAPADAGIDALAGAGSDAPADAGSAAPRPGHPSRVPPGYREQLERALKSTEAMLPMLAGNDQMLQPALAGVVQLACLLGDAAKAQHYFPRITDPKQRKTALRQCAENHVTLPAH